VTIHKSLRASQNKPGIDEVRSELLPEHKFAYVEKFRTFHTIGIAMGAAGTDVAIKTAGIILTTDEIGKVPEAIGLSRKTLNVIKQNILFALMI